jgi:catechol 2,3-dioxygenase-like lactoylglutathione lyase family enzyme
MAASTTNLSSKTDNILSPKALCHVVLRTSPQNYKKMIDFWVSFLGGIVYPFEKISFIRYDEEHHRIGILNDSDVAQGRSAQSAGLEHIAFGYESLNDLALAYKQRKNQGFIPTWCVNHGPATSMYYTDPDGNHIECQVDNFDTVEDAVKFMDGKHFQENPIGVDFDPEVFVKRVESGESDRTTKEYIPQGPRTDVPEPYKKLPVAV